MSKTALNYFSSLLTKNKKLIGLYSFVLFILFPMIAILSDAEYGAYELGIVFYFAVMVILTVALPVFSFKFNLNKKSVDTYYSLPLSRKELFISHYFAPLIGAYVPMILMFLLGILISILKGVNNADFLRILLSFFIIMFLNTAQYSINTFIVNKANSFMDAGILSLAYTVMPYMIFIAVEIFANDQLVRTGIRLPDLTWIMRLLSPFAVTGEKLDSLNRIGFRGISNFWILYHTAILFVMGYLGYRAFAKRKGEDAEQITTNFWTYPLIVQLSSICVIAFFDILNAGLEMSLIYIAISFVIFMIMNFIVQRSFAFNWKLVVKYAVILIAFTGFRYVSQQTEFFGINRQHVSMEGVTHVKVTLNKGIETKKESNDGYTDYEYKEYSGEKLIEVAKASPQELAFIEELQNLQDLASLQFKEQNYRNFYDYDYRIPRVSIDINYYTEYYEIENHGKYQINESTSRFYYFAEDEIQHISKKIPMDLIYDSTAEAIELE